MKEVNNSLCYRGNNQQYAKIQFDTKIKIDGCFCL